MSTVVGVRRAGRRRRAAVRMAIQRWTWNRRTESWDHSAMPGLAKIAREVVQEAGPVDGLDVVDLGSGSGQLTLELAEDAARVTAVDVSEPMLGKLEERAAVAGLDNIETRQAGLQSLDLPDQSADVIVTNYALHHLRHPEKVELLRRAARWLRPGGRIVIGDMMFALVGDAVGRRIAASKIGAIAKRGPAGWWRLAKGAWKMLVARQECPEPLAAWESMATDAGLGVVTAKRVVAEAAVVTAVLLPDSERADPAG